MSKTWADEKFRSDCVGAQSIRTSIAPYRVSE